MNINSSTSSCSSSSGGGGGGGSNCSSCSSSNKTDSKCRPCQQFEERTDHIISACLMLAKEEYVQRHGTVYAELHFNICKEMGEN